MNKYIIIKGKKYLYLHNNDITALHASGDKSHIWNNYGTTKSDIEFDREAARIEEAEYVNNYINR